MIRCWIFDAYVLCLDKDNVKITKLLNDIIPIYEPYLKKYVINSKASGRLSFSIKHNTEKCDAVFITVGTPPLSSGEADLSYIHSAVLEVAEIYSDSVFIIIKSTVPPQTSIKIQKILRSKGYKHEIISNPEFLREGKAVNDFLYPDRIVCGVNSTRAEKMIRQIYQPFTDKGHELIITDFTTSELIKYAANSFLATKIAFINEMSNLCEILGANVNILSKGIGTDKRIGKDFLNAGPGFGGSCFPKDLLAISYIAKTYKEPNKILEAVITSNQHRPQRMIEKIEKQLTNIKNKHIAVFGITFKAGTDDIRSSPAINIVKLLIDKGATVRIYDPKGNKNAQKILKNVDFFNNAYGVCKQANALLVLTEWKEFIHIDYSKIYKLMKEKYIFDFRNILNEDNLIASGFTYKCIGK